MSLWLLQSDRLNLIAGARVSGATIAAQAAAWEAEALAVEARVEAREGAPRNLSVAGSIAEIRVEGTLTKRPDFWSMFMGGGNTTYTSIRQALAMAATDPSVRSIVLAIDSPGGMVDGLFETLDALAALRADGGKPLRVRAENALSAAYAIAAAAGNIEAVSRGSSFGSIGTAVSYYVDPNVVTLSNTDSPDKRPDLKTDEGKAVVVKYLDQVNEEFVKAIARGRDVPASVVRESYGRGASLTAAHAKAAGMIDKIPSPLRAVTSTTKGKAMAGEKDTPESAGAAPAAIAVVAHDVQRGVTQERDRVCAHLALGESSGDMNIALEAIRSGAELTQTYTARYLAAGMNRSDASKRQTEANAAAAVVAGAGTAPAASADLGDQVVANLKAAAGSFVRA